ncbi:hypothetical protein EPD60_04325 [Flaviaesturariibacter flavus]|uniref:Lipoprotein n=1 Tax=Flaviaesturariibacter flavus TaxID=2502780 RepID=A0A4R1BJC2_9BACT|nr:hypothetical protein [Flaviaesturariibacter flavus]TCJ17423.1 hypothetical protein EPD60_04325 [Flaviaesturariibacter flavus]
MKKILVMLAVAATFTACNSGSESTTTTDTSATTTTTVSADTVSGAKMGGDTAAAGVGVTGDTTTHAAGADTASHGGAH